MKMTEENISAKKKMIGAWTGAISGLIFWIFVGVIFRWFDDWWLYLMILFTISAPIKATIAYNTTETKKCPICAFRIETDAEFCKKCGNKIYVSCPECNTLIRGHAQFCQKCGKGLYKTSKSSKSSNTSQLTQNIEEEKELTMFCPYCGVPIEKDAKECDSCGSPL